ncbi:MAG TPA: biopolymer transporter ExbD [Bacteroidia bacterium]|nr:biopolymer transporter ExbD [Bacteroidia bacterium]
MAEIAEGGGGGHGKGGKKRAKKQSTRVDMTPMVDLAFLLLTFFVLTSTFSKPKSMEITFPVPPPPGPPPPEVKNGLTVILSKDHKIFYYVGQFNAPDNKEGKPATQLTETTFSSEGLHKILLEKNKFAKDEIEKLAGQVKRKEIADSTFKRLSIDAKGDKQSLTVLVKTDDKATYKDVIDVVDEMNICFVGKYVIVDMSAPEFALLTEKIK